MGHYLVRFGHRMSHVARRLKVFDFPRRTTREKAKLEREERLLDNGGISFGEEWPIGIDLGREEKILEENQFS